MVCRTDIVTAARELVGTPFHHQARLPGVGVDCVGVLILIARRFGLVAPEYDFTGYPRVPDGRSLLHELDARLVRANGMSCAAIGDVVVMSIDRDPQHVGVLGDYAGGRLSLIHASSVATPPRVIETRLMFTRAQRFVARYSFPGVA